MLAVVPGTVLCILSVRRLAASGLKRLAESGPYYAFRHPLELGCQLVAFGVALALASVGCLITTGPLAFLAWASHALLVEEPALRRRFGSLYEHYRRLTGLVLPSTYVWSLQLVRVFYRLWSGLQIRGAEQVPHSGPLFLVALHRCYMDPYIMGFGVPRKLNYIATAVLFRYWLEARYFGRLGCIPLVRSRPDLRPMMTAFKILDAGGAVVMFPEGARSWYGETACEPSVFKVLEKREVPVVTVEISGAFEHQPRFARRLRRRRIRLQYRLHPPGHSRELLEGLVRSEQQRDARLRALSRPQPAQVAEQLLYVCPKCGVPFRCRGYADGRVECRACGTTFTLLEGKGLRGPAGLVSLPEIETRNLAWAAARSLDGLTIPGALVHRWTTALGFDLQSAHWLRRRDMKALRPGWMRLGNDGITVEPDADIPYGDMDSVLVESNWKVELSYRRSGVGRGYVLFIPPVRYAVFLQHFLRIKAFGNPYARYRGSQRCIVAP